MFPYKTSTYIWCSFQNMGEECAHFRGDSISKHHVLLGTINSYFAVFKQSCTTGLHGSPVLHATVDECTIVSKKEPIYVHFTKETMGQYLD